MGRWTELSLEAGLWARGGQGLSLPAGRTEHVVAVSGELGPLPQRVPEHVVAACRERGLSLAGLVTQRGRSPQQREAVVVGAGQLWRLRGRRLERVRAPQPAGQLSSAPVRVRPQETWVLIAAEAARQPAALGMFERLASPRGVMAAAEALGALLLRGEPGAVVVLRSR